MIQLIDSSNDLQDKLDDCCDLPNEKLLIILNEEISNKQTSLLTKLSVAVL